MDEYSTARTTSRRHRRRRFSPPYRAWEEPASRRKRGWLVPMAALAGVLWLAPWLVAKSPLPLWAIRSAVGDLRGSVRYDSLSLGWFSPITVHGLELQDSDGELLIKIARATTSKRLIGWLINRGQWGAIRVDDPRFHLVFDGNQTNLEKALAPWLAGESQGKSLFDALKGAGVESFAVDFMDGSLSLIDKSTARRCNVDGFCASIRLLSLVDGLKAKLQGSAEHDQRLSPFEGSLELLPPGEAAIAAARNQFALKSEGFPLWVVAAVLRRIAPGLALDGDLISTIHCDWQQDRHGVRDATAKADFIAKNLYATADALQGDQLRLTEARLPVEFTWRDNQLKVAQARFDSELGQVAFAGTLDMSAGWLESLRTRAYQLNGHIEVARVAAMLPHVVRVREDTRITGGVIDLVLNADEKHGGLAWQGRLDASNLAAVADGKALTWEKPVHLAFDAHQTAEGILVDRLYGEADFLELQGEGTASGGHASASFDLDRLSNQLSQFVDLGSLRLGGAGSAYVQWHRQRDDRFEATVQIDADRFELSRAGEHPWREPHVEITADLSGALRGAALQRMDAAQMRMIAGNDLLTARLNQPVVQLDQGGLWSVAVALRGELARWLPRVEPWIGSYAAYHLTGNCDLTADVIYSPGNFEIAPLAGRVRDFRLSGPSIHISEPLVDLSATAIWDGPARQFLLHDARWASAALVAEARDVAMGWDAPAANPLQGKLNYNGNLAQLWQWTSTEENPTTWQLVGQLSGSAYVRRVGNDIQANLENTIDRFAASTGTTQAWQEPRLRLAAQLRHNAAGKLLTLDRLTIDGQALQCTANGEIAQLDAERNLRLSGNIRYDLARLEPVWRQYIGGGLRLEGVDERSFAIRGPLGNLAAATNKDNLVAVRRGEPSATDNWLTRLEGNAELHWTRGDLYGFALGAGDLRTRLARGVLNFDPIDVAASQGRLHLAPTIRLSPGPGELSLARGRLAEGIQITPQMCERGLKFIAPVLAGVTEAQGQFSLDVDGCRIPLSTPQQGDLSGKMIVHSVSVGPGPLVQELAVLMNRAAPARLTRESVVEFRMVEGRIYHRGLELVFPDFTLRTYGSVGLDESLAIMAELPVPPKWIGNNTLGQALQGQTIQLPIGGTLRSPKIDQQALAQANARFLGKAASGVLKQELFRQIDRVLGPR